VIIERQMRLKKPENDEILIEIPVFLNAISGFWIFKRKSVELNTRIFQNILRKG